jgi:hypothetical protein
MGQRERRFISGGGIALLRLKIPNLCLLHRQGGSMKEKN